MAIIPGLILPTGDKSKFLGQGQTIFQPQAIVEVNWGRYGVFRTALNLGMRLRTGGASQFLDTPENYPRLVNGNPGNTNAGIKVGNELLAGLGASWGIVPFVFDLVGEFYTFTGLDSKKINFDGTQSSMGPGGEAVLGIKAYLAPIRSSKRAAATASCRRPMAPPRDVSSWASCSSRARATAMATASRTTWTSVPTIRKTSMASKTRRLSRPGQRQGWRSRRARQVSERAGPRENDGCPMHAVHDRDGDGIPDEIDKCPDEPEDFDGFEDEDGCPDPDNDKDGIPDKLDLCPNDPEDFDGFEDEDGCPDPDNDHDRIPDKQDKCPNEPETYNGFEDKDGCPDKGLVIVQRGKLEILDKIYFETDKDVIKEQSFPLLDAIAATIKGHPEIALIEIQGHADERGDDEHNLDLTDRRAHSVMRALEDRGVELGRLKARGYGETKPICTQHNEECWSKNRRVEFIILKRVDEQILQNDSGQ